jgi:hypothetical protein
MKKQFDINWDNIGHLKYFKKLISKRIKELGAYSDLPKTLHTSSKNIDEWISCFENILNTDLTEIYSQQNSEPNYYVYFHCYPNKKLKISYDIRHLFLAQKYNINNLPFYVGMGSGNRFLDLERNNIHRKIRTKLLKNSQDILPIKIAEGLTQSEAFSLESKLIDILGIYNLNKNGILVNLDEGTCPLQRRKLYTHKNCNMLFKTFYSFI